MKILKSIWLLAFFLWFSLSQTNNKLENILNYLLNRQFALRLKNGLVINLLKRDLRGILTLYEIFQKGIYTPDGFEIEKDDLVIDIGGSIGDFALYAASQTKGKIMVYEPSPKYFNLLSLNVQKNKQGRIIITKAVVTSKNGRVKLYLSNNGVSIYPKKGARWIWVPSYSLSEIIQKAGEKIGLVKIDVEGAEGEIIASTSLKNLRKIKKIALEYHDNVSLLSHEKIASRLKSAGFKVRVRATKYQSPFGYIYAKRD